MKDKYKYCDIIDKKYLLFLDFIIIALCLLIMLSLIAFNNPLKFIWLANTIIWGIIFLIELVQIIIVWRKKDD